MRNHGERGLRNHILAEGFPRGSSRHEIARCGGILELVPPLAEAQGRSLAVQLAAEVEQEAHLRIGATQTDRYPDGRLWINGALAWPDQDLEFVAYSASELTRSKLQAIWHTFSSDWRWPVLLADFAITLTLILLIPALLVIAALPGRGLPTYPVTRPRSDRLVVLSARCPSNVAAGESVHAGWTSVYCEKPQIASSSESSTSTRRNQ